MKFYCMGDEDTVRGFRLAGVEGQVVATAMDASTALRWIEAQTDIGIVILTQAVAQSIRQKVDAFRMEHAIPLLVEIPGPTGPLPGYQNLDRLTRAAIGIRFNGEKGG